MAASINLEDILAARERIRDYVHETPVMRCTYLNQLTGLDLFFKCENFQKTGSFKVSTVHSHDYGVILSPSCRSGEL